MCLSGGKTALLRFFWISSLVWLYRKTAAGQPHLSHGHRGPGQPHLSCGHSGPAPPARAPCGPVRPGPGEHLPRPPDFPSVPHSESEDTGLARVLLRKFGDQDVLCADRHPDP